MRIDVNQVAELVLATQAKGVVLLAAVALAVVALTRGAAAARHWTWFLGMTGLLVLPAVGVLIPDWRVELPKWTAVRTSPDVALEAFPFEASATAPEAIASTVVVERSTPEAPFASTPVPSADLASVELSPAAVLLSVWAAGAALLLLALASSLLSVVRLARRTPVFPRGRVTELTDWMRIDMGIRRPVRVLRGDPGAMPMSWGLLEPVILLPEGAERWHNGRLVSVLLHELAHVRRRDCLSQMIAEAALALHWLNPLAWVAARRLRIEREHACDDAVVSAGARPSDYAEELLSLARGFHAPHRTSRAAVAMARPAHLAARIRTLLQDRRPRTQSGRRALALASLTSVMVSGLAAVVPVRATVDSGDEPLTPSVAPAARRPSPRPDETTPEEPVPALPIPSEFTALVSLNPIPPQEATCGMATSGWERSTSNSNDDEHRFRWSKPGCDVDVRMEGDVEFSTSFRDVARLGRGAFLRIEEEEGGTQRRLDVTPGTDGAPLYAYRVNGNEQPFDAAARAWYEGMLLQIFRRGGFMAEERVAALLASGGAAAVFQELEALSSDYVFATYTRELMEQATLTAPQTVGLVGRAAARVDSDYYMAEILGAVADRQLSSDDVLDAFIAATSSVDSDHYRTEVLSRALDREDLSPARVAAVLESASGISSDFYLAQLLGSIAGRYALEPALRGPYLRAVESIESDHYRTEVLSTLLGRNDLDVSEMAVVLRATAGVDSDHYRTQILAQIATRALPSDALRAAYLEAADGIESDHYRSEALGHLLETSTLSQAQMTDVIRAAAGIESDHYKSALLVEIVRRNRLEGAARDAYMDALESIGSQTYRGAAAEALLRSDRRG